MPNAEMKRYTLAAYVAPEHQEAFEAALRDPTDDSLLLRFEQESAQHIGIATREGGLSNSLYGEYGADVIEVYWEDDERDN